MASAATTTIATHIQSARNRARHRRRLDRDERLLFVLPSMLGFSAIGAVSIVGATFRFCIPRGRDFIRGAPSGTSGCSEAMVFPSTFQSKADSKSAGVGMRRELAWTPPGSVTWSLVQGQIAFTSRWCPTH